MQITYTGPHLEVKIPAARARAKRGDCIDVPDDVAAQLLEQDAWQRSETAAQRKAREQAEADAAEEQAAADQAAAAAIEKVRAQRAKRGAGS